MEHTSIWELDLKKIKSGCTGRSAPKRKSCGQIHKKTPKVDFRRKKEKTFFAKVYDGICKVSFYLAVRSRDSWDETSCPGPGLLGGLRPTSSCPTKDSSLSKVEFSVDNQGRVGDEGMEKVK